MRNFLKIVKIIRRWINFFLEIVKLFTKFMNKIKYK